ncbi:MAG: ATP-binding protein [Nanoarchaeota archaeon]|nr:ATP-binding protein [Nanoarchaeota archaeon]
MDYKKVAVFWKEFEIPVLKEREIKIKLDHDFITTVTGPRRSGKTYSCFQKMNELRVSGIDKENIFYINFEDDKLLGMNSDGLNVLFEEMRGLSNMNINQKIYYFLDEIQNVSDWDAWVRTVFDTDKNVKIIVTGSSSKLLSKEISTKLRGRIYNIEVLPLSFNEYLDWSGVSYNLKRVIARGKEYGKIKNVFDEYLFEGGYPAIFFNKEMKSEVLQSYLDSMILKDVVERYNLRDVKKIEILLKLLFDGITKDLSYNNLMNRMKSMGFDIGKETIMNYISYFEEAYLFFQVLKYEYSMSRQLGSIKKIYAIDNGLLNAVSFNFSKNYGKLLENLVFLYLYRRGKIYYNRDKFECDFLVKEKDRVVSAIQCCYDLNVDNRDREISGLIEAMDKFGLKEGLILTYDSSEVILEKGKKVVVKPVFIWMLEEFGNR